MSILGANGRQQGSSSYAYVGSLDSSLRLSQL